MSWVAIIWAVSVAVSLTLGAIHVVVWFQNRKAWTNLWFSIMALAVAAVAGVELALMRAETVAQSTMLPRSLRGLLLLTIVFLIGFILCYFGPGRPNKRRRAVVVGGSVGLFISLALAYGLLVRPGAIHMPYFLGFFFVLMILVLGGELSREVIRAAQNGEAQARHLDELAHLARGTTLSELSGALAHELNQPLAIILSNAQAAQRLLMQTPPDVAEVREILTDIVAADHHAGEIIQQMRSRLKRGDPTLEPLELNEVVAELLHLINADLMARGASVTCDFSASLPPIRGDRRQLQQVVLNLLLNGADAMSANMPGTRRLHVATARHGGGVRISVRDEGCGLPIDAEQLFEPFFSTKPQSLGMGLAICRSILRAHHGRVWAELHPECGAVFHVELPVLQSGIA